MVDKLINDKFFRVNPEEFARVPHSEYNNLEILHLLGFYERTSGLLRDLISIFPTPDVPLVCQGVCMGGWLPITLSPEFDKIYMLENNMGQRANINHNLSTHSVKNIYWGDYPEGQTPGHRPGDYPSSIGSYILFIDNSNIDEKLIEHLRIRKPVVLSVNRLPTYLYQHSYSLTSKYSFAGEKSLNLYIPDSLHPRFLEEFKYYLTESQELDYDNLIHLAIMVKNAGDSFEKVLTDNLPFIDRWTILDTGSTDDTISTINRILGGKKKGELYQEPFINFRDSRNRCLDLAGKKCKYTLMLDDTYIIQGELRDFLNICRGDQFGTSYSLYIKSDDSEYTSNRIVKTANELRYIYKIHEVINPKNNTNVCIPIHKSLIHDYRCDYMENRTMSRKEYDLKLLFEEVQECPDDPRHLYYVAQTYNLMGKYEQALEYFLKRADHPVEGFVQEKADSLFEAARICNFKLNKPWEECEKLYMRSFELDTSRPESLYFIGIHHYLGEVFDKAYDYMKRAHEIGYPIHTQHSLKPTLSFHYLPKFLAELSYRFKDWKTGFDCCQLFIKHNDNSSDGWETMISWKNIFSCLLAVKPLNPHPKNDRDCICFIADGGFEKWTGRDILNKGMGGSETYIVEISKYVKELLPHFRVIVFCNTPPENPNTVFCDVEYRTIHETVDFFSENVVKHCIISRYSEYIPIAIEGHVENIYLVLHDLTASGTIIPIHPKIKRVLCLSEWHVEYFTNAFPMFRDITVPFHYGIDSTIFPKNLNKIPHRFIYSSTANRGLIIILELWPRILERWPDASLEIFCDLENSWVNNTAGEQVRQIKQFIGEYQRRGYDITIRGWTSKQQLAESWAVADVWFYPCIFAETFCLTALEAAVSKTLVVANNLAGLQQTVGDRGVVIPGNAATEDWKENALKELFRVVEDEEGSRQELLDRNYNWAIAKTWRSRATELVDFFGERNTHSQEDEGNSTSPTGDKSLIPNILKNLSLYYNFRNTDKNTNVLVVGNCSPILSTELLNITVTNLKVEEMDQYIGDGNVKYDLIYLDYENISYMDYCVAWKILNNGGFLLAAEDNKLFVDKYESNINIINRMILTVLEKLN